MQNDPIHEEFALNLWLIHLLPWLNASSDLCGGPGLGAGRR